MILRPPRFTLVPYAPLFRFFYRDYLGRDEGVRWASECNYRINLAASTQEGSWNGSPVWVTPLLGIVLVLGGDDPTAPTVLNTVLHSAGQAIGDLPATLSAWFMYVFQSVFNFFVVSGSGQAALTMPLMAPLADVLGLTRQTAVFAFTCGDGFSNMVIPTSGILMASIGLARVPYERWLRFMAPLLLQLLAVAAVFMAIAVAIEL